MTKATNTRHRASKIGGGLPKYESTFILRKFHQSYERYGTLLERDSFFRFLPIYIFVRFIFDLNFPVPALSHLFFVSDGASQRRDRFGQLLFRKHPAGSALFANCFEQKTGVFRKHNHFT